MIIGVEFKGRDEVLVLDSLGIEVKNSSVYLVVVVWLFTEKVNPEPLDVGDFGGADYSQPSGVLNNIVLGSEVLDDVLDVGRNGVQVDDLLEIRLSGVLLDEGDSLGVEELVGIDQDKPGVHDLLFLLDLSLDSGRLRGGGGNRLFGAGGLNQSLGIQHNIIANKEHDINLAIGLMPHHSRNILPYQGLVDKLEEVEIELNGGESVIEGFLFGGGVLLERAAR